MAKFELPIQYYTVDMLAKHWECTIEEINHLIESHQLETAEKFAAMQNKTFVDIEAFPDLESANEWVGYEDMSPDGLIVRVIMEEGESKQDAISRRYAYLRDEGMLEPVILARHVAMFSTCHQPLLALNGPDVSEKYGEPTEDTAPPSSWPWGDYERPLLRILADAVDHFCVKNDLAKYPKKESGVVANWIMDRMEANGLDTSKSLASAMETLISPRTYSHHRQRKQGKP